VASRPALGKYAWQRLRARALQRDGNRCRHCGSTAKLSVHHLVRPQDGGRDELSNLATLCDHCHRLTHKAMGKGRQQGFPGRGVVRPTSIPPDPPGLEYFSPIEGQNGSRPEDGNYEDDPEAGIFWGPKQPNGMHTRWSRPWFDWRSEQRVKVRQAS
jgi:HNH endonuclease